MFVCVCCYRLQPIGTRVCPVFFSCFSRSFVISSSVASASLIPSTCAFVSCSLTICSFAACCLHESVSVLTLGELLPSGIRCGLGDSSSACAVRHGGTGLLEPGVGEHLPAGPRALRFRHASAQASALCRVHLATLGGRGFIASSFCEISPPWLRTIFFRQGCTFGEDSIGDCCCVGGGLGVSVMPGGTSWCCARSGCNRGVKGAIMSNVADCCFFCIGSRGCGGLKAATAIGEDCPEDAVAIGEGILGCTEGGPGTAAIGEGLFGWTEAGCSEGLAEDAPCVFSCITFSSVSLRMRTNNASDPETVQSVKKLLPQRAKLSRIGKREGVRKLRLGVREHVTLFTLDVAPCMLGSSASECCAVLVVPTKLLAPGDPAPRGRAETGR